MKAVIVTFGSDTTPSSRFRVFQYLTGLKSAGWEVELLVPQKGESAWQLGIRAAQAAKAADLLFVQKRLFPTVCLRLLAKAAQGRLIYDFDDALFVSQNKSRSMLAHARTVNRLNAILKNSQMVIAGNSYLAEYAKKHNPRVEIIPTPIDIANYPRREIHQQKSPQIIGWMGSSSNHEYLAAICPALREICREKNAELQVVSNQPFQFVDLEVRNIPWQSECEPQLLHNFDIGLMPLADDPWTRGKCAFKALQYMAVGLPVVCSPVGMNNEVMQEGVQGFFATGQNEWREKLAILLEDAALREKMGIAGRETVRQNYSTEVMLPWLLQIMAEVAR